ncbi:hypothetical protein [Caldovatus aquaticus]|uniref:Uncharacterized protein n=1 Tax=Caldovatus aquaticus TaxID=2865671 RepID=A0ABS7F0F1_9PROT|nr:hypothetical protein [Caldovatus aquaticus]MBW8268447.1 hypothetical protein [Caldovatus aquaticus]
MAAAGAGAEDAALAAALAGHRVLLAYGLFGEVVAALGPIGLDYMGEQAGWLRRLLGERRAVALPRLPTAAPVADNAQRLGRALLSDPRPAVVVGHSKGGLEVLAALLDAEAAARCRGFLALQAPFFGSPVADAVCGSRPVFGAADRVLRLLRLGSGQGLRDLTAPVRAAWMREHAAAVAALAGRLPMLCAATVVDEAARGPDRHGAGPSDGLVPLASAPLPGVPSVVLRGGHRALVSRAPGRDPVAVLRRLLRRLLGPAAATPPSPPAPAPPPRAP